jgi:hypothetical protein
MFFVFSSKLLYSFLPGKTGDRVQSSWSSRREEGGLAATDDGM